MDINKTNFKDKTILITGSSSGIGEELVKFFDKISKKVICLDIKNQKYKSTNIQYHRIDLSNSYKLNSFYKKKLDNYVIDVLINCAGYTKSNNTTQYNFNDWVKTMNVNLNSIFILSKLVSINMIKNNISGSIINISSIGGYRGFPNNPAYTASKAALSNLTKSMAIDLGEFNIRVNNLVPGYTKTPMNKKSLLNKKEFKNRASRTMLGRWGETKEFIGPAFFLASGMSSYVTGSDLVVDGGWLGKGF